MCYHAFYLVLNIDVNVFKSVLKIIVWKITCLPDLLLSQIQLEIYISTYLVNIYLNTRDKQKIGTKIDKTNVFYNVII